MKHNENISGSNINAEASTYDELTYIDEWISYMKDYTHSNSTYTSSDNDEESSFSSLMNFYLSGDNKYVDSSEDLVNKRNLKLIKTEDISSDNESIDLCSKENLVDSDIMFSYSEDNEIEMSNQDVENKSNEIESRPFTVQITRIDSPIIYNKRTYQKTLINQYLSEDILPNKTFGLISEAKNRAIQQNKRSDTDIPLRKFVIETEDSIINIKDLLKFNDMKNKTIVGKVLKMSSKGYFTENWLSVRENFITLYNSKPHKKSQSCKMNEKNGDLEHPDDPSLFLTKKYTIDLFNCKIYICKNKSRSGLLSCYSMSTPLEEDLVDLSDKSIVHIKQSGKDYNIQLKKNSQISEVKVSSLNFQIKTSEGYRFFKVSSLTEYLTWNVIYRFRVNKIQLNIG